MNSQQKAKQFEQATQSTLQQVTGHPSHSTAREVAGAETERLAELGRAAQEQAALYVEQQHEQELERLAQQAIDAGVLNDSTRELIKEIEAQRKQSAQTLQHIQGDVQLTRSDLESIKADLQTILKRLDAQG